MVRVCIIGAGPSGLAQLRAFESAARAGTVRIKNHTSTTESNAAAPEVELVCYEKQSNWGGLWNYTWRTGVDQHGEPVHCSMYRYLWSNGPKECLEFADYSFEDHFGRNIPSYPPRAVMFDYIEGRVKKAGVRDLIRFNTAVRWVEFNEATKTFTVIVFDQEARKTLTEVFDFVVVASGHFSYPNVPEFPGFDSFPGRILHAHDFRDAVEFKGQDLLIVGTSYSAEDVGSQCWKYGCKSITVTYRNQPMGFAWPNNWAEVPLLQRVEGRTCHFADGSTKDVDAIILCTGYIHHFPFLPDSLRLDTKNILYPSGMYLGVVWEANPQLLYLGMQDQWYTFNMFDAQAWLARDIILGRHALPPRAAMEAHTAEWRAKEDKVEDAKGLIVFQGEYIKHLLSLTDYPAWDVDQTNELFFQWKQHKKEGIMTFRDRSYRSVFGSQSVAPRLHTPWKDALDDSIEYFLRTE